MINQSPYCASVVISFKVRNNEVASSTLKTIKPVEAPIGKPVINLTKRCRFRLQRIMENGTSNNGWQFGPKKKLVNFSNV